ncbi:MAG: MlaD family protein [Treponema sp.]|jgi:phospholipid/cholesterol/gamma-HCH transport system substrate-binding protein|nr:MlaD family protein [Treponema sp.]
MKFSVRFADKIVGFLVILALAILVGVIFMLGKNQRWFTKDSQYRTYFNSASGISTNMAVQYKGFTIGNVKKISLSEDDMVEVIFTIFEEHNHRVKEGSVVELNVSPIGLGSSFLFFYPGRGLALLPADSIIPEINSPSARQLMAAGMVNRPDLTGDAISNIVNHVNTLLGTLNVSLIGSGGVDDPSLRQIINNVERASADIGELAQSLSLQLDPILNNIDSVTGKLSDPSGTVMSILDGENSVYTDLAASLDSISSILNNIEKTSDLFPSQLPSLLADLNSALRSAQDVLIALTNNPLLRRGVPERMETGPAGANSRHLDF